MRILHTSDWHLGISFGPVSLQSDQEAFVDWFVALVADQQADLVVIAGDIYDRSVAPNEAIELFKDAVRRLLDTGARVAAITGNHDGASRVAPYDDLLDRSGFLLRGGYEGVGEVVRQQFSDGPLDLVLLPFLDPQAAPDSFGVATDIEGDVLERRRRRTHHSVLESATTAAHAALGASNSPRSLAIAHAFVAGGDGSDSERRLVVGGTADVDAALFNGFSYTALGHLHRPQTAGTSTIRYSGTPLAYSYSENHAKEVVLVDMAPDGGTTITGIPVAVGKAVCTITGTIEELLDPTRHVDAHGKFVRAHVTNRETVLDAKARLAQVYPHITEVQLKPEGAPTVVEGAPVDVAELAPIDATRQFWEAVEGSPPAKAIDDLLVAAVTEAAKKVTA